MIAVLTLLIGLQLGFYGQKVYTMLKTIFDDYIERKEASETGVVRPIVSKVTRNQPINLESDTGAIMRPSPNQIAIENLKAREKHIKNTNP